MADEVKQTVTWKIVFAWAIVLVPLLWGVETTVRESLKLMATK